MRSLKRSSTHQQHKRNSENHTNQLEGKSTISRNNINIDWKYLLILYSAYLQIMSSKRKSPPTKVLDGSNNNNNSISSNGTESKLFLHQENDDVMPATEIDLSIKSSSSPQSNNDIDTYNEQILNHHHHRRGSSSSPIIEKFADTASNHHQQHNQMNGDKMSGNIKRRGGDIQVSLAKQLSIRKMR